MIAALLLLAAQPGVASETRPAAENDIVINGVRKIRFSLKTDKAGNPVCRIRRSSGDPEIDGLACDAARACMKSVSEAAMVACLTPRFNQIPAQIAARRRQGSSR